MTKNVPVEKVVKFTGFMGLDYVEGRSDNAAQLHSVQNQEENSDQWIVRGDERTWKRQHRQVRRELFTPYGLRGSPPKDIKKQPMIIATLITANWHFQITDSWKDPQLAHRQLNYEWTGTTTFVEKSQDSRIIGAVHEDFAGANRKRVSFVGALTKKVEGEILRS